MWDGQFSPRGKVRQQKNPEGVFIDAEAYHDYVKALEGQPQSLAVAILGKECPVQKQCCCKVHVPAQDMQHVHVILKTCLHQFGKLAVQPISKDGDNVPVAESKLVAITLCFFKIGVKLQQKL